MNKPPSKTPIYQKILTWCGFTLAGVFALGQLLDSIGNTITLIDTRSAVLFSIISSIVLVTAEVIIRRGGVVWIISGNEIRLVSLGWKPRLMTLGMIALTWCPLLFRPKAEPVTDTGDWPNVFTVEPTGHDYFDSVFPPNVVLPILHLDEWYEKKPKHESDNQLLYIPIEDNPAILYFTLTSNIKDNSWVKLDGRAKVSVKSRPVADKLIGWYGDAGGGGEIHTFTPFVLDARQPTQTFYVNCTTAPYLEFEPGELEELEFPFKCIYPGIYSIKIEIPYSVKGQRGIVPLIFDKDIVFPNKCTVWQLGEYKIADYEWRNKKLLTVREYPNPYQQ